jgi:formylglycine-generating enzyme required for sulfatase activity
MAEKGIYCYRCGAANAISAETCAHCGAVLYHPDRDNQATIRSTRQPGGQTPPPLQGQFPPGMPPLRPPEKVPAYWPWLVLAGIVLLVIFLFAGRELGWFSPAPTRTPTPTLTLTPTFTLTIAPTATFTQTPEPSVTPTMTDTPGPTATLGMGSVLVSPTDGMGMVLVPGGAFPMGSPSGAGREDERPQHNVYLATYWIDQTEVTNGMYQKCVSAGVCSEPHLFSSMTRDSYYGNPEFDNYPVINVDWFQAGDYCAWAGRSLPTEAQWEKAAKGTSSRLYPWEGNEIIPGNVQANYNNNIGDTTEVGSFPRGASPYGALDMAGNVWEWTADFYDAGYYSKSPLDEPLGPSGGSSRVIRGGSWNDYGYYFRTTNRGSYYPTNYISTLGFRCAVEDMH